MYSFDPQEGHPGQLAYTFLIRIHRRLSSQFQFSLSAVTLGYLSQWSGPGEEGEPGHPPVQRCRQPNTQAGAPGVGEYDLHCKENSIYVFPKKELRSLSPSALYKKVSDFPVLSWNVSNQTVHGREK